MVILITIVSFEISLTSFRRLVLQAASSVPYQVEWTARVCMYYIPSCTLLESSNFDSTSCILRCHTVAAILLHRAIGDRFHAVMVDNGCLRKNEGVQVVSRYSCI